MSGKESACDCGTPWACLLHCFHCFLPISEVVLYTSWMPEFVEIYNAGSSAVERDTSINEKSLFKEKKTIM